MPGRRVKLNYTQQIDQIQILTRISALDRQREQDGTGYVNK